MTLYIVHMPSGKEKVEESFPLHYQIDDSLWAIGSDLLTCADVCVRLGGMAGAVGGVVVKFDEFYGRYDPALWQKLKAWGGGADRE